jgi:glycosyltransferase involved in cell wall biosynthesis
MSTNAWDTSSCESIFAAMHSPYSLPSVSVVTVVFNGADLIEGTMRSVLGQTYPNLEYVIIDGASSDGTPERIVALSDSRCKFLSEPDKGLYDAMNKGLQMATGSFVLFMNAGDAFYTADTLLQMFASLEAATSDVIYGETMIVAEDRSEKGTRSEMLPLKLPSKLTVHSMQRGMVVCHQSFMVKRTLAPSYLTQYRYCADVDWVIRCLKKAHSVYKYPGIIASFLDGGLSRKKLKGSLLERFLVLQSHFGFFRTVLNHVIILFRSVAFILRRGKLY